MRRTKAGVAILLLFASASAFAQTQDSRDPQPSFKDYVDLRSEGVAARDPQPSFKDFVELEQRRAGDSAVGASSISVAPGGGGAWPQPSFPS